jgi:hypothetical protein
MAQTSYLEIASYSSEMKIKHDMDGEKFPIKHRQWLVPIFFDAMTFFG